ncbi:hypothetical protein Plhal304r1_c031g0101951 [Plasmopara halstedii]
MCLYIKYKIQFFILPSCASIAIFCFAIKLKGKPYHDSDTNERVSLSTSTHEAYALSSTAHRYNVALVDNEVHVNNKANEERISKRVIADVVYILEIERPTLPVHGMHEMQHSIQLESGPSRELAHVYDVLRFELYDGIFAYKLDLEIDELLKSWLRHVQSFWNLEDNPSGFDIKVVLNFLVEKLSARTHESLSETSKYQLDLHRQVVKLFDQLLADLEFQSFARDVLRVMVLDSTYKTLVFEKWTQNLNRPEDMLDIFVDQSFDRYINFVRSLRKFKTNKEMDRMLRSRKFISAFSQKVGDGVYVRAIQYAWEFEKWMSTSSLTVHNSNIIQKEILNLTTSSYSSFVAFDKLVKLLISLQDDLEVKQH